MFLNPEGGRCGEDYTFKSSRRLLVRGLLDLEGMTNHGLCAKPQVQADFGI